MSKLENLIDSLPKTKKFREKTINDPGLAGFCLRFSVEKNKWVAAYGRSSNKNKFGLGDTPLEAMESFIAVELG